MPSYIGQEQEVKVGEKTFRLSRLSREIMQAFANWAKARIPDPLDALADKINKFPPALQEKMVKEAMREQRRMVDYHSPEVQAVLKSIDGSIHLLVLLLKQHQPAVTEEEAWEVLLAMGEDFREPPDDSAGGVSSEPS